MEKKLENSTVVVTDDEGKEYLLNILFTYHNDERDADYVFVYDKGDEDTVYVLKYGENNDVIDVIDEEELAEAEEVLAAFNEDPTIQSIK